jgi:hypothetical protein
VFSISQNWEKSKMPMPYQDAIKLLIEWLRKPEHGNYTRYGYDVYLPGLVINALMTQRKLAHHEAERQMHDMVSDFYAPAWDLCRRGILRPGIRAYGQQATPDGSSGNGYSITPFGRVWLAEADQETFVPTEPERFGKCWRSFKIASAKDIKLVDKRPCAAMEHTRTWLVVL